MIKFLNKGTSKSGVPFINTKDYTKCLTISKEILPYTKLSYIESTGTQYINLNTSNLLTDGCIVEAQITVPNVSGIKSLFGAENASPYNRNYLSIHNSSGFEIGAQDCYSVGYTIVANQKMDIKVSTLKDKPYLYINGVSKYQGTVNSNNRTTLSLCLFGFNQNGTVTTISAFKLYSFKLYDKNNTLLRDLIPVKDENGVVCLYDKITKQFFYNQGTGDFIAGYKEV